ncbi:uba domain-containing protein rup1 [Anaeramoeba ignava]|uniref:Uba domain-containing protein rup1 n=1 Tax=Anaeramoeba ignava TaxID=1746090 RepID=A0A9Q0L9T0_ANAIG|nr:uba domain-containing protein rup1 [Anaeramoeba ignava]
MANQFATLDNLISMGFDPERAKNALKHFRDPNLVINYLTNPVNENLQFSHQNKTQYNVKKPKTNARSRNKKRFSNVLISKTQQIQDPIPNTSNVLETSVNAIKNTISSHLSQKKESLSNIVCLLLSYFYIPEIYNFVMDSNSSGNPFIYKLKQNFQQFSLGNFDSKLVNQLNPMIYDKFIGKNIGIYLFNNLFLKKLLKYTSECEQFHSISSFFEGKLIHKKFLNDQDYIEKEEDFNLIQSVFSISSEEKKNIYEILENFLVSKTKQRIEKQIIKIPQILTIYSKKPIPQFMLDETIYLGRYLPKNKDEIQESLDLESNYKEQLKKIEDEILHFEKICSSDIPLDSSFDLTLSYLNQKYLQEESKTSKTQNVEQIFKIIQNENNLRSKKINELENSRSELK